MSLVDKSRPAPATHLPVGEYLERKEKGKKAGEARRGELAGWLDGQMDEETDGWVDRRRDWGYSSGLRD